MQSAKCKMVKESSTFNLHFAFCILHFALLSPRPQPLAPSPSQKLSILRYSSMRRSRSARSIVFSRSRLKSSTVKLAARIP